MPDIASIVENIRGGTMIGISAMTLMSNMLPGLPEEIFLILVGYVVALGHLKWWVAYITLATPLMLSDVLIYSLARGGNKWVMRMKKRLLGDSLEKNFASFEKNNGILLFGSRFVFQLRVVGLVVAGITKMPLKRFLLIDFFSVTIFVNLMLVIGVYLRSRFLDIKDGVGVVQEIMSIVMVVVLCVIAFFVVKKYFKTLLSHLGDATERGLSFLGVTFTPSQSAFLKGVSESGDFEKQEEKEGGK